MGKITIEEEAQQTKAVRSTRAKRGEKEEHTPDVLDQGRVLGPMKKKYPESFEKLEALATAMGKKKVEVVAEAIDFYFNNAVLGEAWSKVMGVTPEQFQACWMIFQWSMKQGFNTYVSLGKEFIEGSVQKFHEMIERVKAEAYIEAQRYYEAQLERERRRYEMERARELRRLREEKTGKIAKKIDALMDILLDTMFDQMVERMVPQNKIKTKLGGKKIQVKVKGI